VADEALAVWSSGHPIKINKNCITAAKQDFYSFKLCTVDKGFLKQACGSRNQHKKWRPSWSLADAAFWLKSATAATASVGAFVADVRHYFLCPSVRPSVPSIDSNTGGRRIC